MIPDNSYNRGEKLLRQYETFNFIRRSEAETGSLYVIEESRLMPFEVKRVYFIVNTPPGVVRGCHAHKTLEQVIFCPAGACDFVLDDGHEKVDLRLDDPGLGLYLRPGLWREFTNFTPDCVVMVLAGAPYDEGDYIRSYAEFLEFIKEDDPAPDKI